MQHQALEVQVAAPIAVEAVAGAATYYSVRIYASAARICTVAADRVAVEVGVVFVADAD